MKSTLEIYEARKSFKNKKILETVSCRLSKEEIVGVFGSNTYNAVVQRFNIFQLFTTEPSGVFYMKDDTGKWVQVVSLIKWKGFFFPYPTLWRCDGY